MNPQLARLPEPFVYQETRWCANCGGPQLVISIYEIEDGRLALCVGCERGVFLPFTRSTSEAA